MVGAGDLSENGGYLRIVESPPVPPIVEHGLGLAALCTVVFGLAMLMSNKDERDRERRWRSVFGAFFAAGVLAGFGLRLLAASTVGANIGRGLFLYYGVPTAGGLALWGALRADKLARRTVSESRRPPM